MSDAYAQGIHHALTALAWAAGVVTVLLCLAATVAALLLVTRGALGPLVVEFTVNIKARRLRREHARSGRH